MLNIFKSITGANSYLGVDIGTTSIKISEISKGGESPEFKNYGIIESYGHLERPNDAIQTSSLKIAEKNTADLLKTLLDNGDFKTKDAIASISSFSAFTTLLEIPQMSNQDVSQALNIQIQQYIPMPISEVAIDWIKVGEREDEKGIIKQQIFLISIPNEQIEKYKEIFKLAGLNLRALEVESLSLVRAIMDVGDNEPTLIADIGSRLTNVLVVDGGFLKYTLQTDFAGASLTQAISRGLGINVKRAEELKKQRGVLNKGGEYELSTLTLPFLDAIINEVKRAKDNYEKNYGAKIEKVFLSGGGANTLGIDKYFGEQMGLKILLGNPFSRLNYPAELEPLIKELGFSLAVSIGLGIKEFIRT